MYYLVTLFRNKLYDLGIKQSMSYDFPVICVGNLSTGGTGKTPMIEYLIRLLKDDYQIATLSRGYKRTSQGFQIGEENSTVNILGDEPFQFYSKFKNEIQVAVDANRHAGITALRALNHAPEIILLDDAFQHRRVKAGFNILLTTYANPYFKDMVLPTGNLREPRHGAKRAQIIIVTKCPNGLTETDKKRYVHKINPEPHQAVFFSSIGYSEQLFSAENTMSIEALTDFTLVTGIANPMPLIDFLKSKRLVFEHLNFKDHHHFTFDDIATLEKKTCIVATEKDFMRLKQYDALRDKLFYLPIRVAIDDSKKFNALIKQFVSEV